ncbi:MAG: hypothetical protein ACM31P_16995 [Actinomycetota bacterium]
MSPQSLFNRRSVSRYHLVHPLPGYIEHGDIRHASEIVEISTAGFRVRLRNASEEDFTSPAGSCDFGEVIHEADEIAGFGEIRYVRPDKGDLWIGFKWDEFHVADNIQKSYAVIAQLIARGVAGCVNIADDVIRLGGHVSSALFDDLQQCVALGFRRVSLQDCTSVDTGGLSMLAGLDDIKVRLEDMSPEIATQFRRYRQRENFRH